MNMLKRLWNRFVEGFETGVYNLALVLLGVLEALDISLLQPYMPEKFAPVFIVLGLTGGILRYFVNLPWFKKFKEEDSESIELA